MRSHVWPAWQVTVRVFQSEKRIPAGEAYPSRRSVSFYVMYTGCDNHYLVEWEVREIARSVAYPVIPVVNATILAELAFLADIPVCSFYLLLIQHAAFKSYNMLVCKHVVNHGP
jgi:hypothetical protein